MTDEDTHRRLCDRLIQQAAFMAVDKGGVPIPILIDRLATFAAGQSVLVGGKHTAADTFRAVVSHIEAGAFDHLEARRRGTMN